MISGTEISKQSDSQETNLDSAKHLHLYFKLLSFHTAILQTRSNTMFCSGFESIIAIGLKLSLHKIHFQKVTNLLTKENFILDLYRISQSFIFEYFLPSFKPSLVEHLVVAIEDLHHGLEQSPIKHQSPFMRSSHIWIIIIKGQPNSWWTLKYILYKRYFVGVYNLLSIYVE